MLFNSYEFIFLYLPITLVGFFIIGERFHHRIAIAWLVGASLFFYGWWNPAYIGLIIGSMLFNYAIGIPLASQTPSRSKKTLLIIGISINLGLLGYYKYANFFVSNLNHIFQNDFNMREIILPLAISFFTFQQITYIVDAYRGETREYNFLHYCLFVTFFPQLIAGPIVHHREMLPQFSSTSNYKFCSRNFAVGLTIFLFGLFKKAVLADGIAVYSTSAFSIADSGVALTFFEALGGAIAYTMQLYFDFSGYSDMAIGVSRMFGIRLPLNFNSPYKSTNIIIFWRRWHITLSRFLRDYLYIPLGGNRKGFSRKHINLIITMLLGGLWHGAGWNFVIWGGLHGIFLSVNQTWRHIFPASNSQGRLRKMSSWLITFLAVILAWVPFRAETLQGTINIWKGMLGLNGISLPPGLSNRLEPLTAWLPGKIILYNGMFSQINIDSGATMIIWIVGLTAIALLFPNTQQIMHRYRPAFETYKEEYSRLSWTWLEWRPTTIWTLAIIIISIMDVLALSNISEFLYFQF